MIEKNNYYDGKIEENYQFLKGLSYCDIYCFFDTSCIYFLNDSLENILVDCCFGC